MAESHLEFTKPSHVVGRYALYGRLAAGGMATVHLGRVLEPDGTSRTVAVKRLHPQFCKDPEFVAMFIDEARLAARIKHPNVVETLDILTMGQELLLVMEYIRGECFSKLLRAARRKNLEPSIGIVGRIASGMLHGLHAAHEARDDNGDFLHVVHRDISPQNVMIDVDGGVKVLDFGVAKASARIQITRDGQMKGKLSYMSPEQLQGLPVDRRADVFACGVVLWEALTRRRLFVGEDASEVLRKILRDEVPPPSHWMPGLTPEVDQVVLRALSKDPEVRYQTAEDLAVDVERIIELASLEEVGQWLDSVAGEILGKRERLLQEIERLGATDVSFDPSGQSTPGHGSITDSDTFQRIQSWAEREAARVAADGQTSFPIELEDAEAEPTKTVADARCAEDALPPPLSSASELDSDVSHSSFGSPIAVSPILASPIASGLVASGLVRGVPGAVAGHASAVPAAHLASAHAASGAAATPLAPPAGAYGFERPLPFSAAAQALGTSSGLTDGATPRRQRRTLFMLAAAAAVLGLGALALVGVEPSTLVRTNALLPEASRHADANDEAHDGTLAAASTKPAGSVELAGVAGPNGVASGSGNGSGSGAGNDAARAAGSAPGGSNPGGSAPGGSNPAGSAPSGLASTGAGRGTSGSSATGSSPASNSSASNAPANSAPSNNAPGSSNLAAAGAATAHGGELLRAASEPGSTGTLAMARGLGSRAPSAALQPSPSEEARNRVSEALTQAPKDHAPPPAAAAKRPPPKRAVVARRAKPAPAVTASAKTAPAKVDCRQPFWIDEGGIRRLKMACL